MNNNYRDWLKFSLISPSSYSRSKGKNRIDKIIKIERILILNSWMTSNDWIQLR